MDVIRRIRECYAKYKGFGSGDLYVIMMMITGVILICWLAGYILNAFKWAVIPLAWLVVSTALYIFMLKTGVVVGSAGGKNVKGREGEHRGPGPGLRFIYWYSSLALAGTIYIAGILSFKRK